MIIFDTDMDNVKTIATHLQAYLSFHVGQNDLYKLNNTKQYEACILHRYSHNKMQGQSGLCKQLSNQIEIQISLLLYISVSTIEHQ